MFTRPMLKRKEEKEESALFWPLRKKNGVIPDSEKMHKRRWENLCMDCITKVFARVGMESLILSLPFVCKSWYAATLDPLCWQYLYFPDLEPSLLTGPNSTKLESYGPFYDKFVEEYHIERNRSRFSITAFIKLVVNRSNGKALELKMPGFSTEEALRYVSDACPNLRVLNLPDDLQIFKHSGIIPEVIGKWKSLEQLHLGSNLKKINALVDGASPRYFSEYLQSSLLACVCHDNLNKILEQIGIHCKHFMGLQLEIEKVDIATASEIVKYLPDIKFLKLIQCYIQNDGIVTVLLNGCKELEIFYVRRDRHSYRYHGFLRRKIIGVYERGAPQDWKVIRAMV
ncbi:hypothetical protein ACLB2K_057049 [Fragaria x ananassa]